MKTIDINIKETTNYHAKNKGVKNDKIKRDK